MRRPNPGILLVAALCGGCQGDLVTDVTPTGVAARQASWRAQNVRSYSYEFDEAGFFNACPRPVRVTVRGDTVVSATVLATGQPVAPELLAACAPTIDRLFTMAIDAARSGALSGIRYDASAGYPVQIVISGPPDASGRLSAGRLQPGP